MSENIPVVIVDCVDKTFMLPHERNHTLKSAFVNIFKRKRTYEKQQVLKNINFTVNKGEFFGIVGRNGSGKSTLLKLLAGIYEPDNGSVHVEGQLVPFIELGVGFNPELTGRENVYLNGALLGFSRKEVSAMYDDIVEFAELDKFMDQRLKNYSSGMHVRLAFSIAIRANSDILLIDEVLAVGDAAFQAKCFDYFRKLKEEKKTVIFVSHDMKSVQDFCDRAILIRDGVIAKKGKVIDVTDEYTDDNVVKIKKNRKELPGKDKIALKITRDDNKELKLDISFETTSNDELYVGLSLLSEGRSIAEITSSKSKKMKKKGKLEFVFQKDMLNPGVYNIGAGLFKVKNRNNLCSTGGDGRVTFIVKGHDPNRGRELKLEDTWVYDK